MFIRIVIIITLLSFTASFSVQGDLFPIQDYELRRPLQYFFHLMELKAKFNPMFGAMYNLEEECSSKAGPFCQATQH